MSIRFSLSCSFTKVGNELVFPDTEPPIINILYGWSGMKGYFLLWSLLFLFLMSSKLNISASNKNNLSADKNEFMDLKRSKKIFSRISIL